MKLFPPSLTTKERCSSENCLRLGRRGSLKGFVVDGEDEVAFLDSLVLLGGGAANDVPDGASVTAPVLGRLQVKTQVVRLNRAKKDLEYAEFEVR